MKRKDSDSKINFIDRTIAYFSPRWGANRQAARIRIEAAMQFRGAESGRLRSDWILGQTQTTPSSWELQVLRNRSRDLNCNDPVASGATETMATNIVGRGLRPQSRLRAEILGISEDRARELQRQAEFIWQTWTPWADSGNRLDFDELQFLALRKVVEDGEIIALPVMAEEPWRPIRRAVELIEVDRLMPGAGGSQTIISQGVELGTRGEPVAYWLAPFDPKTGMAGEPKRIEARDKQGRPRVLHIFRTSRPGQLRGVPFFAPVLTYFKDLADYLEAEVVAARVAACLAVFITKTNPYLAGSQVATGMETNTGARVQGIEPGLVSYLALGEDIKVVDPKRGGETFSSFVEGILRIIGVALGLPYELLVKDFSKTNYSSARAALLEGRRMFINWRSWFAARFCQPLWDLVLEEAFLRGQFDAPKFYDFRSEYARALWIGGGWGWVDPVKEVQSSKMAIDYNLSTLAEEVAGQGRDWEEVLEQKKREQDRIAELGLTIPNASAQSSVFPAGTTEGGQDVKAE
ncbi:MAG: phage portal protein [Deltaproteobacteria bacterium RBG_13_58_19]|nr:MAG: phage portal protein [Deltaproteobacteria bacterium RBG_13_58_19]